MDLAWTRTFWAAARLFAASSAPGPSFSRTATSFVSLVTAILACVQWDLTVVWFVFLLCFNLSFLVCVGHVHIVAEEMFEFFARLSMRLSAFELSEFFMYPGYKSFFRLFSPIPRVLFTVLTVL